MQQFSFIVLFKSALHVSGEVFAHLQEQFNCIYSFGTMHRPVQCTDLLLTGDTVEMELSSISTKIGWAYWLRLFSSQAFSLINTPTFSNLVILHTYPTMKMEHTECFETSTYKIQTPGNYPEESIQQSL
jgi:hypothetical protein